MKRYQTPFTCLAAFSFVVVLASVRPARADIDVFASAEDGINDSNTESARGVVWYKTGSGMFDLQGTNGASYSYSPDDQPGHQNFSGTANGVVGTKAIATVEAELGRLHAYAGAGPEQGLRTRQAFSTPRIDDTVTFTNSSDQPLPLTVRWHVDGVLNPGPGTNANAYHTSIFNFLGSGGIGGNLRSDGLRHQDSSNNSETWSQNGWDQPGESYEVSPNANGVSGLSFTGHLMLPSGKTTFGVTTYISIAARGGNSSANFSDTVGISFDVPPGVSFTSQGGLLNGGSRLVNISTRAKVLGGDSVEIGGFIVTGNVPKKVIIRGIGPSLVSEGVSDALSDPTLELHHADSAGKDVLLAKNNDWKETQQSEIEATTIPPSDEKEAAIVATLDPGNYTAVLRGNGSSTGIGLVEVFDLAPSADSKLANISTRAFVEAGENVLIGGIIGGGNGSEPNVVVRAIGSSLTAAGVAGALQDPLLELHDKDGTLLAMNDDWQSDQKDAIEATGLAPTSDKESAILATLQPTNYTAIVKGVNSSSGVALVEVYHIK